MHKGVLPLVYILVVLAVLIYLLSSQINSATSPEITSNAVSTAPLAFFLNEGESKTETYWGHEISVEYISTSPMQNVKITVDDEEFIIENEPKACELYCGEYWNYDNLALRLEPVTWIENPVGEKVWSFETWDTNQIFFKATVSQISGGKAL